MIITEQKLRKIIKKLISENDEEYEYYGSGSSLEDSLNQGDPDPERYSLNSRGEIKDIKYPGYKLIIIDGKVKIQDEITGEIYELDEFNEIKNNINFKRPKTYENEIPATQPDPYDMPKRDYDEEGNILPYDLD